LRVTRRGSRGVTMNDQQSNFDLASDLVQQPWPWIALRVGISLVAAMLVARKAGYSHYLGALAILVPVLGTVLILAFAVVRWPALKERDDAFALLKKNNIALPVRPKVTPAAEAD